MFENEVIEDPQDQTTVQTDPVPAESATGTPQEALDAVEAPVEGEGTPDALEGDSELTEDPEAFPREYVVKLRKENASFRERAKRADDLAHRLHTSLVEATGKLADSRDLPFDETHIEDPAKLSEAIATMLADRPHLASRKPAGKIGQGVTTIPDTISLGGLLRAGAR